MNFVTVSCDIQAFRERTVEGCPLPTGSMSYGYRGCNEESVVSFSSTALFKLKLKVKKIYEKAPSNGSTALNL